MKIEKDKVVEIGYTLTVNGKVVEETSNERPLQFIYGRGYMLEKFESFLSGLTVGDKYDFTLLPSEGYGDRNEEAIVELPIKIFEIDGKTDPALLYTGAELPMMDDQGRKLIGIVKEVNDDIVVMDFNHILAGEKLHFVGEVYNVREASLEELSGESNGCGCCSDGGGCGSEDGGGGCCSDGGGCGCSEEPVEKKGGCGSGGCGCN